MDTKLRDALAEYAKAIKQDGWSAGEPIIAKYKDVIEDFERWALAIRLILRTEELVVEAAR